ncbi:FCD domain-containing protein [Rhodococcus hoagii]|uniref:FCD domain-containing protein n=2 Tax=Rhodococcus hoagii TaxID=43767 RepID=A0AAE2W934_RHOHA|nr:FadR/GntR family transcriptional regulator [Prescottella equi]GBF12944.1 pyruvate dehydrogenase complex repressor [Rhodococcus sp. Br-6]AVP69509.1 FadR family transcriptional regulator [Prescottella equi]ERN44194.1 GntR family transcriptional regulator [Prescottella equi NBRC 101255 = C 7]MBM4473043.1 FCD domain-containing protein [Prescottella equi]MBM4485598.1 FCD domain-containing protein [Prescottella equi]
MQPVRRSTLITQVTDQLRDEIRSGKWPVGSRIPTEPELSELTGTGRNTVREAVQALVHTGLLERRQGSGTYVLAASEVSGTLGKYFAGAHERDVLELRQSLDVTAAGLAARRRDDQDIRNLRALLAARSEAWHGSDLRTAITADIALHRGIVAASHNRVYLEFYDSLLPAIEETVTKHASATGAAFHDEHSELVEAVIDGDSVRAVAAARCFFDELLAGYA